MKKYISIIILLLLSYNLYSSSSDEFQISLDDFTLNVSWHLSEKFIEVYDFNYFIDIINIVDVNYDLIKTLGVHTFYDCSYDIKNSKYIIKICNKKTKEDAFYSEKIVIIDNEIGIREFIIEKLKEDILNLQILNNPSLKLYMLSVPNESVFTGGINSYRFSNNTEIYWGATNGVQNNIQGYSFLYFFNIESLNQFILNNSFSVFIINEKNNFTQNNYDLTLLK